jgi:hypothetical protein
VFEVSVFCNMCYCVTSIDGGWFDDWSNYHHPRKSHSTSSYYNGDLEHSTAALQHNKTPHITRETTECAVAKLVGALCCKKEGRGFDSRRHWVFQLT